ncbi:MAG TPA: DUF2380 domain-containing protein, partial [Alphaproteobacteria bacterium]|nr:DUF2380 domain-containing protein [Alphaproteobacteria bacterium]
FSSLDSPEEQRLRARLVRDRRQSDAARERASEAPSRSSMTQAIPIPSPADTSPLVGVNLNHHIEKQGVSPHTPQKKAAGAASRSSATPPVINQSSSGETLKSNRAVQQQKQIKTAVRNAQLASPAKNTKPSAKSSAKGEETPHAKTSPSKKESVQKQTQTTSIDPQSYEVWQAAQDKSLKEFSEDYKAIKHPKGPPTPRTGKRLALDAEYLYYKLKNIHLAQSTGQPAADRFAEIASLPLAELTSIRIQENDPLGQFTPEQRKKLEQTSEREFNGLQSQIVGLGAGIPLAVVGSTKSSGVKPIPASTVPAPVNVNTAPASQIREVPKTPIATSIPALKAPKMADHHIFPQQFKKFFEQRGINIDKFTVSVGETTHLKGLHGKGNAGLPGKWNKRWLNFIERNPNASTREIYQFGGKLMDEYKLNGLNLHGYKE